MKRIINLTVGLLKVMFTGFYKSKIMNERWQIYVTKNTVFYAE